MYGSLERKKMVAMAAIYATFYENTYTGNKIFHCYKHSPWNPLSLSGRLPETLMLIYTL